MSTADAKTTQRMRFLMRMVWTFDARIYASFAVSLTLGAALPFFAVLIPRYVLAGVLASPPTG